MTRYPNPDFFVKINNGHLHDGVNNSIPGRCCTHLPVLLFSKYLNRTSVLHKTDMRREFQFIQYLIQIPVFRQISGKTDFSDLRIPEKKFNVIPTSLNTKRRSFQAV